ncbi:hypothetical protein RCL1_007869 [Eukaryota sp. TZLM3-RCL]
MEYTSSTCEYEEICRIGAGAQGSTYLMRGPHNTQVCGKFLHNDNEFNSPEAEMILKNISSPFLVPIYKCIRHHRGPLLIMEYCPGGSLHDFVMKEKLTNEDIWVVVTQLVHGLKYLHDRSIIHRDLKPGNIVLVSKERPLRVKICDFGISRDLNDRSARSLKGTPDFLSPEFFEGKSYGVSVDMWALGVLIYLLVHRTHPFSIPRDAIVGSIPVSNSEFGPIISRLLVRDPAHRATAAELITLPKIIQTYRDVMDIGNRADITNLKEEVANLKAIISEQSNLIDLYRDNYSSLETKFSNLQSQFEQQSRDLKKQSCTLLKVTNDLRVKLEQGSLLSREQCEILDEVAPYVHLLPQLRALPEEQRRVSDENRSPRQHSRNSSRESENTLRQSQSFAHSRRHSSSMEQPTYHVVEEDVPEVWSRPFTGASQRQVYSENTPTREHGRRKSREDLVDHNLRQSRSFNNSPFVRTSPTMQQPTFIVSESEPEVQVEVDHIESSPESELDCDDFTVNPLTLSSTLPPVTQDPFERLKFPSNFFKDFGGKVLFIEQTKGQKLHIFDHGSLVVCRYTKPDSSFVAINHPQSGIISLILKDAPISGAFSSYIGYFNPNSCQNDDCHKLFTGVHCSSAGLNFYINGRQSEKIKVAFDIDDVVEIEFTPSHVSYQVDQWSKCVARTYGWVFGMVLCNPETWVVE